MPNSSSPRRLLLHNHLPNPPPPPPPVVRDNTAFDANVVMVLSVLFCALICSLGLNSIIRCAIRCSTLRVSSNDNDDDDITTARLANTGGVKKKALKTFPTISYAADLEMTECAICLSDFASGERVRVLPTCHHGFHVRCIDRWLDSHSSCPTCRHCLLENCNKIVEDVVVRIEPLQPEGLITSHGT